MEVALYAWTLNADLYSPSMPILIGLVFDSLGKQLRDRPASYWAARFNNARVTVDLARDNIRQSR